MTEAPPRFEEFMWPDEAAAAAEPAPKAGITGEDEEREIGHWIETNEHEKRALAKANSGKPQAAREESDRPFEPPEHWRYLDLADLGRWEVQPLRPIVDGMIAHGNLVYVAAETQTGKSLLALNLARRIVTGGRLFGKYRVHAVSRVLYLVLEDPDRRLKDRLLDMEHEFTDEPAAEPEACVFQVAPGFNLNDARMFAWLEDVIDSQGRDVVILDTYQRATPGITSFDDEAQSLILHRLADLTRRLATTLIVIDHIRKAPTGKGRGEITIDDVKGSGSKAQNADCVILMQRTKDREQVRFQCFSKDFDPAVRIMLNVSPRGSGEPKFTYAGDLEKLGTSAKERGQRTQRRVLDAMTPGEWYASSDLARTLELGASTVKRHLQSLVDTGQLDTNDAKGRACRYWRISPPHDNGIWAETDK